MDTINVRKKSSRGLKCLTTGCPEDLYTDILFNSVVKWVRSSWILWFKPSLHNVYLKRCTSFLAYNHLKFFLQPPIEFKWLYETLIDMVKIVKKKNVMPNTQLCQVLLVEHIMGAPAKVCNYSHWPEPLSVDDLKPRAILEPQHKISEKFSFASFCYVH